MRPGPTPRRPDLVMAAPRTILIATEFNGRKRLHFTTSIANIGVGPMEIDGARFQGGDWSAWQRIVRSDGSSYRVPMPSIRFVYQGSEDHGHWHIDGAARYELWHVGKIAKIRTKRGFCLYDSSLYRPRLPEAGRSHLPAVGLWHEVVDIPLPPESRSGGRTITTWRITGQQMDVTNLPNGRYRLINRVDPRNLFRESQRRQQHDLGRPGDRRQVRVQGRRAESLARSYGRRPEVRDRLRTRETASAPRMRRGCGVVDDARTRATHRRKMLLALADIVLESIAGPRGDGHSYGRGLRPTTLTVFSPITRLTQVVLFRSLLSWNQSRGSTLFIRRYLPFGRFVTSNF